MRRWKNYNINCCHLRHANNQDRKDIIILTPTHVTSKFGVSYCKSSPMDQRTPWGTGHDRSTRLYRHTSQHLKNVSLASATLLLKPYFQVSQFTGRKDHEKLWWILNMADATGRLVRRHLWLLEFNFEVLHQDGVKHRAADALSHFATTRMGEYQL